MRVFVYGSLKKDYYNHKYIQNCRFISNNTICGYNMKYDKSNKYPFLFKGNYCIKGQVYEIDNNILNILDELEQNNIVYKREEIVIDNFKTWIYLTINDSFDYIEKDLINNIQAW